jgi:2-polyprenyl-3-methyl-5-hydroxy-6-metoxy-1,4-benzoquinol methylase
LSYLQQFVALAEAKNQSIAVSLKNTLEEGGERISVLGENILERYQGIVDGDIEVLVQAYATMVMRFNKLQLKYEISGSYPKQGFDQVKEAVYDNMPDMTSYMLGLVCSQFAWSNHFRLWCFFEDKFLNRLSSVQNILEFAPGHGHFGLSTLQKYPNAQLIGIDISPASVKMSTRIATSFDHTNANYRQQNAMALEENYFGKFDAVICGELLEHVPEPDRILASVHKALTPGGVAYVTAAITAAAPDHIYEFTTVSEVTNMVTASGLEIIDQISESTRPLTDQAKGAPTTIAMIVTKG